MTTVIYDGTHLYADSQVTKGDVKGVFNKIRRVVTPTGPVFVVLSGEIELLGSVIEALEAGEDPTPLVTKDIQVMVIRKNRATLYTRKQSWAEEAPVFLGSGSSFANGAYHATGCPKTAMEAAIALDLYSSGPIVKVRTQG